MNIFDNLSFDEGRMVEDTVMETMLTWYPRVTKIHTNPDTATEVASALLDIIFVVTTRTVAATAECPGIEVRGKRRSNPGRWEDAMEIVLLHVDSFWECVMKWSDLAVKIGVEKENLPEFIN